ncbi:MAG: hypothetical protein COS84_05570 [Armatimonadetes bacterium CG07_land_8_20_14_0_80_40_9]|nr:MAG: hypothetical protein COS84_05570 [Armatimonadetes bacterium CG07_land_8_20_14_0_80_40_9]
MIIPSDKAEKRGIEVVAYLMCVAARTAPKTGGLDNIVSAVIGKETKEKIVDKMKDLCQETGDQHFLRDAEGVSKSELVVLLGTTSSSHLVDLGIALGSAVSIASNHRVDNRIMGRIGLAAQKLKLLGEEVSIIYGIPLSVSGKNIFFDRGS